jgi:hypothetical protein
MTFDAVHENRPSSPEQDTHESRPSVATEDQNISSASGESKDEDSDDEFTKELLSLRTSDKETTEVAKEALEEEVFFTERGGKDSSRQNSANGHHFEPFASFAEFNAIQHNAQADLLDIGIHKPMTAEPRHSITDSLDLLNLGVAHKHVSHYHKSGPDSGIDLLKLSTSPKQHYNVDLFGDMKPSKSADDILRSNSHEEDDFFRQLSSRSSGSSVENLTSPESTSSATFDHFGLKANTHSSHHPSGDAFDPFNRKTGRKSPASPLGGMTSLPNNTVFPSSKNNQAKSTNTNAFPASNTSNQNVPDLFGNVGNTESKKSAQFAMDGDLFAMGFETKPSNQTGPDLLGEWGEAFKSEVPLNPVPSPLATPPVERKAQGGGQASSDPFADFGNIKGHGSTASFTTIQKTASPSQQRKTLGGTTWNQQQAKPQARPTSEPVIKTQQPPAQSMSKPNYSPMYSSGSGGGSVFGEYGLRSSHCKYSNTN